ncbi:hypothetical protein F511_19188 [Dorcoceras hygrometricum]|uniref:Uncharacterized protein n=1 Tax=Dorcoceras hygrometricum TaxID=472368 RepID=A0A2Z7A9L6_9LAMI|nr:hypothetical protein F511_19188 [Dorcoceras hygrometricum]
MHENKATTEGREPKESQEQINDTNRSAARVVATAAKTTAIDGNRVRMNSSNRGLSGMKIKNIWFENILSVDRHLYLNPQSKLQQKSSSTYSNLSPTQILVLISFHSKAEASRIWFSKQYPKRRSSYLSKRRSVGVTLLTTDPANAPQILIKSASSNALVYTVPLTNVDI